MTEGIKLLIVLYGFHGSHKIVPISSFLMNFMVFFFINSRLKCFVYGFPGQLNFTWLSHFPGGPRGGIQMKKKVIGRAGCAPDKLGTQNELRSGLVLRILK